jgi:hypothetical protein
MAPSEPADLDRREAHAELTSMAHRTFAPIPPGVLASHVLAVTAEGDWPVHHAAMEALIRRQRFASRDGLRVIGRPQRSDGLGAYRTSRRGRRGRPYDTRLVSVDPPQVTCDCPDYVRSALGLCKHGLVVLRELYGKPRKLERARRAQPLDGSAHLGWDPIRPLDGAGDWLERVVWREGPMPTGRPPAVLDRMRRWLGPDGDGTRRVAAVGPEQPDGRLRLVDDLLAYVRHAGRRKQGLTADPVLARLLADERERLVERLDSAGASKRLRRRPQGLKNTLYPYQRDGVRRFLDAGRLLLADDMGLGKTAQAIASAHVLFQAGKVRRGLILVPASLKPQWLREWQAWTDVPARIVDGSPAERHAIYRAQRRGFLIMNYEQLLRDLEQVEAYAPQMVVLDEAQRIKNWSTKTAAYVKRLQPPYRLVLTGTPMENRLDELASIVEWVDELALEPVWRLGPWHTATGDGRPGAIGARNLNTLRERLRGCMLRRVRQEVLDQLPPRTDTRVAVAMTEAQEVEHSALIQPIRNLMRVRERRPLAQAEFLKLMMLLTKQRIICNGLALSDFEETWGGIRDARPTTSLLQGLSSPKLIELRELVQNLVVEQGRKVVIFSQWRRMLQLAQWTVADLLAAAGARAVFFSGGERQKRRTQNIVDFHDDPDTRILLATDAGGVGLNLQRAATCCINLELPWNPAVLEQRVGRIYRLGQQHPVEIYNLVSESGIESRIATLVANKTALFSGLFDGTSNEVSFTESGSFLSRLEGVVEPGPEISDDQSEHDEEVALVAEADFESRRGPASCAAGPREDDEPVANSDEERGRETDEQAANGDEERGRGNAQQIAGDGEERGRGNAQQIAGDGEERGRGNAQQIAGDGEERGRGNAQQIAGDGRQDVQRDANDGKGPAQLRRPEDGAATPAPYSVRSGPTPVPVSMQDVAKLIAQVEIQPRADGGMTIQAPPDAARRLATLLYQVADSLSY